MITCEGCRRPIQDSRLLIGGRPWHKECFRCAGCKEALSVYRSTQHGPLCISCYERLCLPGCDLCGLPCNQQYSTHPFWKTVYCHRHPGIQSCRWCGKPTPREERAHCGGSVVCRRCHHNAVTDIDRAASLTGHARDWIAQKGLTLAVTPTVSLHTPAEMGNALGKMQSESTVFAQTGLAERREYRCHAKILKGMPEYIFCAVAVHELGHAYQYTHDLKLSNKASEEGFCEVLSYLYCLSNPQVPILQYYRHGIANNPCPIYGGGFRRLYALHQRYQGLGGLIGFLRQQGRV